MNVTNLTSKPPSGALLQKLFNSLNEIVCVIDPQGYFVYLNQATHKIWGYRPEELLGKPCYDYMVESDRVKSLQAIMDTNSGKRVLHFENRYYHRDGRIITMFWEGGWDDDDEHLYCTGRDISEQRRLEKLGIDNQKELQTTKDQLEQLLNRITDGFVGLDEEARITYWNKAAEVISERPYEEVIGRVLWDVVDEPAKSLYKNLYKKTKAANQPGTQEIFIERVQRWIELNTYVSGSGLSVFFRDITEKKRLQEALLMEKEQLHLEKELQQKRITTAVIKATEEERALVGKELHDNVNQVLTTIKLYNEICLAGSEKRQELLNKSTRLLQTTISEIRGLSKRLSAPSLGGIHLYESIGELVEAVNVTNRLKIIYKHNISELKIAEDAHIAIYRIIQEHFTNILKHAKATTVTIQLMQNRKELLLTVNDNGIGFNPQLHYKGIGLENMNSRTESLNGQLQIDSTPGMGCTMKVTIPLQ